MRVFVHNFFRVGDTYHSDHFDGFGTGFFFIQFLMNDKRLHDLAPYGENRVQAGHGLLENH